MIGFVVFSCVQTFTGKDSFVFIADIEANAGFNTTFVFDDLINGE